MGRTVEYVMPFLVFLVPFEIRGPVSASGISAKVRVRLWKRRGNKEVLSLNYGIYTIFVVCLDYWYIHLSIYNHLVRSI